LKSASFWPRFFARAKKVARAPKSNAKGNGKINSDSDSNRKGKSKSKSCEPPARDRPQT